MGTIERRNARKAWTWGRSNLSLFGVTQRLDLGVDERVPFR